MKKVGEIFAEDNFGAKAYYKVLSVNADGTCVAELQVGYIPPTTVEDIKDMIETVKEKEKENVKETEAKKKAEAPKTVDKKKVQTKKPATKKK